MTTFSWQRNFSGNKIADAQDVGQRLEQLRRELRRPITAEDIVDDAKAKSSQLHAFFEWDDTIAAHKWRVAQTGRMIGSLQRAEKDGRGRDVGVRAFVAVTNRELATSAERKEAARLLVPSDVAMADVDMRNEILHRAMYDAERFTNRWGHIKQLAKIFQAVEITKREVNVMSPRRKRKKRAVA